MLASLLVFLFNSLTFIYLVLGFLYSSVGKESACNAGDLSSIPGMGTPLEKEMVAYSSILAWIIPWTEEPGGLQSMESQESDMT